MGFTIVVWGPVLILGNAENERERERKKVKRREREKRCKKYEKDMDMDGMIMCLIDSQPAITKP